MSRQLQQRLREVYRPPQDLRLRRRWLLPSAATCRASMATIASATQWVRGRWPLACAGTFRSSSQRWRAGRCTKVCGLSLRSTWKALRDISTPKCGYSGALKVHYGNGARSGFACASQQADKKHISLRALQKLRTSLGFYGGTWRTFVATMTSRSSGISHTSLNPGASGFRASSRERAQCRRGLSCY